MREDAPLYEARSEPAPHTEHSEPNTLFKELGQYAREAAQLDKARSDSAPYKERSEHNTPHRVLGQYTREDAQLYTDRSKHTLHTERRTVRIVDKERSGPVRADGWQAFIHASDRAQEPNAVRSDLVVEGGAAAKPGAHPPKLGLCACLL